MRKTLQHIAQILAVLIMTCQISNAQSYNDSTLNEIHSYLVDFKSAIATGDSIEIGKFIYLTESERGDIVGQTIYHIIANNENKRGNFAYSNSAFDLIVDSLYVEFKPVPDNILQMLRREEDQKKIIDSFDKNDIALFDVQECHILLLLDPQGIKLFFWENMNALLD